MDNQLNDAITRDFRAFLDEFRSVEPPLDLEPGLLQYIALCREAAFRAGWAAGQHWQAQSDIETTPARSTMLSLVRALIRVGDRAWVQPQAIIESTQTGEMFVEPLFPISRRRSDRYCIELTLTAEGLVASGPNNRHRLSPEIDRQRLRPLAGFEVRTTG